MRSCVVSLFLFVLGISAAPSTYKDNRPTIPLTKRSNLVKDGIVNINALRNHVTSLKYKYANSLAKFERNTGKAHPGARVNATVKRQTGRNPLKGFSSVLWYGPITVGGQHFTVDFDTGSSDLILPGPKCGSSCDGHKIFNTRGAKDAKTTFRIEFGDSSAISGEVYTDSVTVAGLTAKTQALGVANKYSSSFVPSEFPADGILGMAYPAIAEITVTKPFFNTLIKERSVSSGEFGFKLAPSGSVLYFGGVDKSSSRGRLNTLPVTQKGYWQVNMDSVNVGSSKAVSSLSAIIDTGTTLIVGDPKSVSHFYKSIHGARDASSTVGDGFYTFPCNSSPQVSMTFGGISYDISSTFNIGTVSPGSKDCVGGIVGQDTGMDAWITGDVFLTNVYAEFSFDHNTVSFSKQA